jgi:hypothetical protein
MNKRLALDGDFLRVIVAALVWFACMFVPVFLLDMKFGEDMPEWIMTVTVLASFLIFTPIIFILFNIPFWGDKKLGITIEQQIHQLEQAGLLESRQFIARRAFEVEQIEDEGSQYFIELDNGQVLFLMGQYLWDYEPMLDNGNDIPRKFPSTEFVVQRHRDTDFSVDVISSGEVLEPEVCAPHFTVEDYELDRVPDDGEIISHLTYDEVKERIVNRVPLRP